jgi:hypothetical protein
MSRNYSAGAAVLFLVVGACASAAIPPAQTGAATRLIDEPCNPANSEIEGPTRMISLSPAEFPVPARWIPDFRTLNDIDFNLQRTGATLNVWKGSEYIFKPVLPLNSVECVVTKGDTAIKIRTTMLVEGITNYRVDVSWQPQIDGQYLYMQLQTRFPENLKQIRGVIDGVRFPVRTASTK